VRELVFITPAEVYSRWKRDTVLGFVTPCWLDGEGAGDRARGLGATEAAIGRFGRDEIDLVSAAPGCCCKMVGEYRPEQRD
jgi:hypothetical protein